MFSILGGYHEYIGGGDHEYIGGGGTMSTSGDIMIHVGELIDKSRSFMLRTLMY